MPFLAKVEETKHAAHMTVDIDLFFGFSSQNSSFGEETQPDRPLMWNMTFLAPRSPT